MIALEQAPSVEPDARPTPEQPKVDTVRYRRLFEQWRDLTKTARDESLIDDDYYHGKQLTTAEKQALSDRGQPDIIINRTRAAVNGIVGVIERGRTDPRAFPRNPTDEDTADVATDALRYIGDKNRWQKLKGRCFREMLVAGTTAAIITANNDLEIVVQRIRFEEFCHDPKSREEDFTDARWMGIAKWMYADDLKVLYPDKGSDIDSAVDGSALTDDGLRDRPTQQLWIDSREKRLLVVEMYHRDDGWKRCVFHAGGALAYGPSPFLNDRGQPCNPIEAISAYVDRDNNRSGAVRDMRGPQDEINKRRSKLLHLINVSQIQAVDPSAIMVNADEARKEAAKPDGVIPFGWQKVPTTDASSGQALLLQEAKNEIERLGPNPAIVGRESGGASGRALQARTQAGLIELAILFSGLEDWELRVWRQCWARAKQYWKAPQWIRVSDDEDAPKYVGLNMPRGQPQPAMDEETGEPKIDPKTGQPETEEGEPQFDPLSGQSVFGYKNTVGEMDIDITMDSTPDMANIQAEQFADLVQLVASNPAYAQSIPFEVILELSSVPHKRRLINKLKELRQQAEQQQAMAAQRQEQMAVAELTAKVGTDNARAALDGAKADGQNLSNTITAATVGLSPQPSPQAAQDPGDPNAGAAPPPQTAFGNGPPPPDYAAPQPGQ